VHDPRDRSGTIGGRRSGDRPDRLPDPPSPPPSRPAFTGLLVHRDLVHRYSLLVPDGWHGRPLEGDDGVLFAPDADDPHTSLSVSARDLGTAVRPSDLPTLRRGFLAGLRRVPGSRVENVEAEAVGDLLTMEARQSFREDGALRKRWIRLAYQGRTQVRVVAQGATPALFAYWEPMFFQAMRTLRFGDWTAEMTGMSWARSLFPEHAEGPPARPD
jgi:hypothetical protein